MEQMMNLNLGDVPEDGWFPLVEENVTDETPSKVWTMKGALRTDATMTQWLSESEEALA